MQQENYQAKTLKNPENPPLMETEHTEEVADTAITLQEQSS